MPQLIVDAARCRAAVSGGLLVTMRSSAASRPGSRFASPIVRWPTRLNNDNIASSVTPSELMRRRRSTVGSATWACRGCVRAWIAIDARRKSEPPWPLHCQALCPAKSGAPASRPGMKKPSSASPASPAGLVATHKLHAGKSLRRAHRRGLAGDAVVGESRHCDAQAQQRRRHLRPPQPTRDTGKSHSLFAVLGESILDSAVAGDTLVVLHPAGEASRVGSALDRLAYPGWSAPSPAMTRCSSRCAIAPPSVASGPPASAAEERRRPD